MWEAAEPLILRENEEEDEAVGAGAADGRSAERGPARGRDEAWVGGSVWGTGDGEGEGVGESQPRFMLQKKDTMKSMAY